MPMFDPPWVPVNTGTVPDAISEDQSVSSLCWYLNYCKEKEKHKTTDRKRLIKAIIQKRACGKVILLQVMEF